MIKEIIINTPLWVVGLFFGLLVLGFKQSKDRIAKKAMVYPMPVSMIFLSFFSISSTFGYTAIPISLWVIGMGLGTLIGAKFFPIKGATYSNDSGSYSLTGSWAPLMLIMVIFATKYTVGALAGLNSPLLDNPTFIYVTSTLYGVISGIFASRLYSLWKTANTPVSRSVA